MIPNIDSFIVLFERLYPNTTKAFKDIYKLFIERALVKLLRASRLQKYRLTEKGGVLGAWRKRNLP